MISNNDHVIQLKDGRNLGYSEYGDAKGKPIFYFHGWPSSRLMAREVDESAKKLKIRVISIDRPGYGLSDFQKNRKLLDWPDDVLELADQLKFKKFAVMGVSGGGPYAAVCAYKIPKRLTKVGIVVGVAPTSVPGLLDGMGFINKLGWANYGKSPVLRRGAAMLQYFYAFYSPSLGIHRFIFGAKPDQKILNDPKLRAMVKENYRETFKTGYKGPELDLKLYTTNWGFDLSKIKAKVFLWYGSVDKNVSYKMGEYYASKIPGSKLVIYPNEGHLCRMNHEEEILKALL